MSKRSDDYRYQYLKKNKGLFGLGIYFCAYCKKPITKSGMEVDHILPVSKVGVNHTMNLVCACRKCNRKKSDKIDHRVVVGFADKIFWSIVSFLFALVLSMVKLVWTVIMLPMKMTVKAGKAVLLGKVVSFGILALLVYLAFDYLKYYLP